MQIMKYGVATLGLALLSTTALAADLPSRRAPPVFVPPPIPVFTWTGLYVGGQVGYQFGKSNGVVFSDRGGGAAGSASPNGVVGGGHIGYNFSTQSLPFLNGIGTGLGGLGGIAGFGGGGLVVGIEGDVDGSNYRANYGIGPIANNVNEQIQGSARGRVGLAFDRVLFYATGGAAFGDLRNNYAGAAGGSFDMTRVGYTVGGGVEYAITNNWSLRAEYRYTDYGSFSNELVGYNVQHHETNNRVEGGFSYRFATPIAAPVVARY